MYGLVRSRAVTSRVLAAPSSAGNIYRLPRSRAVTSRVPAAPSTAGTTYRLARSGLPCNGGSGQHLESIRTSAEPDAAPSLRHDRSPGAKWFSLGVQDDWVDVAKHKHVIQEIIWQEVGHSTHSAFVQARQRVYQRTIAASCATSSPCRYTAWILFVLFSWRFTGVDSAALDFSSYQAVAEP